MMIYKNHLIGYNIYEVIFLIYGKYKNVRDAAWRCLIDNNINSLPVSVTSIAKKYNIFVRKYSQLNDNQLLSGTESGTTLFINGKFFIIYKDSELKQRCRFTIAHEIGHIVLGHPLVNNKIARKFDVSKPEIEIEADIFASRLLAPACVLWGLDLHEPEEIAEICNISFTTAKIRAERMEVLYKRNKFLTSNLEKVVYNNFNEFISNNA